MRSCNGRWTSLQERLSLSSTGNPSDLFGTRWSFESLILVGLTCSHLVSCRGCEKFEPFALVRLAIVPWPLATIQRFWVLIGFLKSFKTKQTKKWAKRLWRTHFVSTMDPAHPDHNKTVSNCTDCHKHMFICFIASCIYMYAWVCIQQWLGNTISIFKTSHCMVSSCNRSWRTIWSSKR